MKKLYVILLTLLFIMPIIAAQDFQKQIYTAYVNNELMKWEPLMAEMENKFVTTNEKLELISYYYGFTAYAIGKNKQELAKAYIQKAENLLAEILNAGENATAYAFKGAFLSFKVALNKMKALTIGTDIMKFINKAYELDPTNVQAIADKANLLFYTPNMLGGDKNKALDYYEKAIKRLEDKGNTHNWFYLLLLTTLAQCYDKTGNPEKAYVTYQKIIDFEPEYKWVKERLLPDFLKRNQSWAENLKHM